MNGGRSLRLDLLLLTWLCASTACARQIDFVALRHTQQTCQASSTCPEPAERDAGREPDPSCDATNSCEQTETDPPDQPAPPCPGAPGCPPAQPPEVIERCETRVCAPTAESDTFCGGDGLIFALGDGCENEDSNPEFRYALCSETDLIVKAPMQITGSAAVDNDVTVSSDVMVEGELRYSGSLHEIEGGKLTARTTIQAQPTCALPATLRADVASSVQARANDNDNDLAVDQLALLSQWTGQQTVTFPCGRYYLSEIDGAGSMTIQATGHVAIFVDGSVSAKQGLTIRAAPSARVSLVVNGSVHIIGGLQVGELADARHLLLAAGQIHLEQGSSTIGGVLYTQTQDLLLVNGTLDVNGAVFAYRAQLEGATHVTLARSAATADEQCKPVTQ